ncbi:MAG: DUF502 domain-containing protein [Rhabdochlamydiaceae bacterium]
MFHSFKKNLVTGLIILLPIAVTIALLGFLINLFTTPFVHLVSSFLREHNIMPTGFLFLSSEDVIQMISKLIILILLFIITVILGILTRWFVITSLLSLTDKLLKKIPVVNTVYKASQEITKTFLKADQTSFKQVVMVPFPRKDSYALGLVSRDAPENCSRLTKSNLISVLVPTTPNPTSGFLLMVDQDDLIYLDMKPEDAIKYIISVGVITPEIRRGKK